MEEVLPSHEQLNDSRFNLQVYDGKFFQNRFDLWRGLGSLLLYEESHELTSLVLPNYIR
jgi:hypothetical protein